MKIGAWETNWKDLARAGGMARVWLEHMQERRGGELAAVVDTQGETEIGGQFSPTALPYLLP